jgi:hypothetical protein
MPYTRRRARFDAAARLGLALIPVAFAVGARAARADDAEKGRDGKKDHTPEFSGRVTTGFRVKELKHGEAETKGRVELETDRREKAKIEIEAEASSVDKKITLIEAYIDQKLGGDARLIVGYDKKLLGLEYELGDDERLPIYRTLIYRKLETFAYVGRESTVRYEQRVEPHSGDVAWTVSAGYGESLDADVMASVRREVARDWTIGAWTLLQSDKINRARQVVWATMLSTIYMPGDERFEAELAAGQDPFESEFQKTFGDGKNRYYGGWRLLYGQRLGAAPGAAEGYWEPFAGLSGVRHDMSLPHFNTAELLLGVNYRFTKALVLGVDVNLVATQSKIDRDERTFNDSGGALELKYVF